MLHGKDELKISQLASMRYCFLGRVRPHTEKVIDCSPDFSSLLPHFIVLVLDFTENSKSRNLIFMK